MTISIFEHTQKSYAESIFSLLGKGYDHASYLYAEWFRKGTHIGTHPAFKNAGKLLEKIVEATNFSLPVIHMRTGHLQTEKMILQLIDGKMVEAVAIPMKFGWSLCVSSQVGCKMGCTFCQTGKMGLLRHLTTAEIVSQLFVARFHLGYDIRNIVFMGMGEPMDNFDAVKQAIEVFSDLAGFAIGLRHITVSTSGRVDGIQRMMNECHPALNLAISINASNDLMRTKIMPVNRRYNMSQLKQVLEEYCRHPRRKILVEYVLLKEITDSPESADELADYLKGLKVKINLIPYNPQQPDRYQPPEQETLDLFAARLRWHGYPTLVRNTKGQQIMAACGQLGDLTQKKSIQRLTS